MPRRQCSKTTDGEFSLFLREKYEPGVVLHVEVLLRRLLDLRSRDLLHELIIRSEQPCDVFAGFVAAQNARQPVIVLLQLKLSAADDLLLHALDVGRRRTD